MKFIKGLILFVLINGTIIFLLEKIYDSYQNTYDLIFKDINRNKDLYTDVYIGNSHTIALQTYTNKPNAKVINIATPGQDLFKTYTILKKWIPLMSNVKNIYVGLDFEMLGQNLSLSGLAYEDRQLYLYTDTLYIDNIENRLMAKSNFFRSNRDLKFLVEKQNIPTDNNYIPPVIQLSDEDCKKRALEHSQIRFKQDVIKENINLLVQIINLVKTYNKKLIIFNPPKSICFKKNGLQKNIEIAKNSIDSVFNKMQVKYYNYYEDADFADTDFIDYDHVNENGRKKLINKINLEAINNQNVF